jgi:hypothetical protein
VYAENGFGLGELHVSSAYAGAGEVLGRREGAAPHARLASQQRVKNSSTSRLCCRQVTSVRRSLFEDELRAMESEVRPKGRWKPHVSEGRAKILGA